MQGEVLNLVTTLHLVLLVGHLRLHEVLTLLLELVVLQLAGTLLHRL